MSVGVCHEQRHPVNGHPQGQYQRWKASKMHKRLAQTNRTQPDAKREGGTSWERSSAGQEANAVIIEQIKRVDGGIRS